ncbi:MAG: transcription-repair coupling factor, partial [Glaciecola sp.]
MPNIFKPSLPKPRSEGKQAQVLSWGNLAGSSSALAIASAIVNDPRPFVLLTADSPSALRLEQEIRFFLGEHSKDYRIQLFPDWETLPYDHFSPHQDIVSQRLETLFELKADAPKVVILPVNTAMQRLAPTSYLSHYVLFLKTGQTLDIEAFRRQLEQAGYLHVSQVMNHSEFSVRGSIIDLFPMGSD